LLTYAGKIVIFAYLPHVSVHVADRVQGRVHNSIDKRI